MNELQNEAPSCPLRADTPEEADFDPSLLLARREENGLVSVPLTVGRKDGE